MQITEKLLKPIIETRYLSAESAFRYRTIIRFFYIQYEKIKYWLYKEDIYGEMMQHEIFADYTMEQCKRELDQLTEWGNLIANQDTAKVHTVEDFKNKQYRYQLSEYTVEIERMTLKLENLFVEGASLEPTLLERIRSELSKIKEIAGQDVIATYAWWDMVNSDFIRLNQNYQDYIRELNSVNAEELMKTKEFLIFKDKLIEYLRTFIKSLQKNTAAIESILRQADPADIDKILNKVLEHELSVPRLDVAPTETDILDMITGRWESIREWFIGSNGMDNEAAKLLDATNEIIRRITRYAAQITELYSSGASRRDEYRKLSRIFADCSDIDEAHKLSALVFGIEKPIHIRGDFARKTDSINSGVYEEEPFYLTLTGRSRTYKEIYYKSKVRDFKHEKQAALQKMLQRLEEEQKLLDSYIVNGRVDFASLPVIEPEARNVLLKWLTKGLDNPSGIEKTEDGRVYFIDRSHAQRQCRLRCSDGAFIMPHYQIVFKG